MGLFSVLFLFIVTVLSSLISCRFLILFSSAEHHAKYYVLYAIVSLLINHVVISAEVNIAPIINQLISILIALTFSRFVLKSGWDIALLGSMLNGVVFGIYNIAGFSLSAIVYRETPMSGSGISSFISALTLVLSAATLELIAKRGSRRGTWNLKHSVLYICPLAFIYFVTQTLINIAYNPVVATDGRLYYGTNTAQDVEILFTIGISLISIFVIQYFYEKVMTQIDAQRKMLALEAYTEIQKQYIDEAKQKYENTKAFRHDVKNHMATLARLAESNESEKIKAYLSGFNDEVKKLSFKVFTGNAVIDVLFKEKFTFAKEQGIKISCDAVIPKGFFVNDFDLCIIFFNALDNAIKGCAYAAEKWIDVVAKKNKDLFIIDIINSFDPERYHKGCGIGLETIRFIAEKYGGCLEISNDEGLFRISMMFSLK